MLVVVKEGVSLVAAKIETDARAVRNTSHAFDLGSDTRTPVALDDLGGERLFELIALLNAHLDGDEAVATCQQRLGRQILLVVA